MAILYKLDGKEQSFQDRVKDCIADDFKHNAITTATDVSTASALPSLMKYQNGKICAKKHAASVITFSTTSTITWTSSLKMLKKPVPTCISHRPTKKPLNRSSRSLKTVALRKW